MGNLPAHARNGDHFNPPKTGAGRYLPAATVDLQLTGKSTHLIKGSLWLLLSIANTLLSQEKPPSGATAALGVNAVRTSPGCKGGRFIHYTRNYRAEGRCRPTCPGKTRQGSFACGGNGLYQGGLGGSVGNWRHELTFPRVFHHPKQFWYLKMPQLGASLLCREGRSDGTPAQALCLGSGGSSSCSGPCYTQPFAVSPVLPTPHSLQCFLNP